MTAVIFDLDGTLVDSAPAICAVVNTLLAELSVPPLTLEDSKGYMGYGAPRFLDQALASRGIGRSEVQFAEHLRRFLVLYEAAPPDANPPFPAVQQVLDQLVAKGVRLGLCTNKPTAPTYAILRALAWDRLFSAIVTGDTLPQRKPSAEPVLETARRLGSAINFYVGDSEVDAEAARAARLPFILHERGYRRQSIEEMRPQASFTHYEQLPKILASFAAAA